MAMDLFEAAYWLRVVDNQGYGSLRIPSPRDDQITTLLRTWIALDAKDRLAAAEGIREDRRFTLLAYAERMASLAVRERNQDYIILGLAGLGTDGWRGDWQDNAAIISLHYGAAGKLGLPPQPVFETAAALLSANPALALRSFLNRLPQDKTLEAMGYIAGQDDDGFRYERTW